MFSLKKYKILTYTLLALVIIISFFLTNLLLNLVITGKLSGWVIIYILINLLLNFGMFFLVFRFTQLIIEKESALQELLEKLKTSKEVSEKREEIIEEKELNIEDIIHQIIPQSPQNLTLNKFSDKILANIAKVSELVQGVVYVKSKENGEFKPTGKYAYYSTEPPKSFFEGETIPGQVAKNKKILNINNLPENYFTIISGLGKGTPNNLLILPILEKEDTIAVIEMATFKAFDKEYEKMFEKLAALLGKIIVKLK